MKELPVTDQLFINKLTDIILANLKNENFGVKYLARESGMSRSGLGRKLHRITAKSTNQFIREVRLQKALEMLQQESLTASEVAYRVGFGSPAYFNTCFHEYFGYPPGKIKKVLEEIPLENLKSGISESKKQKRFSFKGFTVRNPWFITFGLSIVLLAVVLISKILKQDTIDDLRSSDGKISIAVMPLQNLTNDTLWNTWQYSVQQTIISSLTGSEELTVRQSESINSLLLGKGYYGFASVTPSVASKISKDLDANAFAYGSINRFGNRIRIIVQLMNTKTKQILKSFMAEGPAGQGISFHKIDSLSLMVRNYLELSKLGREASPDIQPEKNNNLPEAYRYFILADEALSRNDIAGSRDLYARAVQIDSNFIPAIVFLSMRYYELGMLEEAKKWCLKAYDKREMVSSGYKFMAEWYHATLFGTPEDEVKYLKLYQEVDDQVPVSYWQTGNGYRKMFQYDKAIIEYEKTLRIYKKWGIKPMMMDNYTTLIEAYYKTGNYNKGKKLFRKAARNFPDDLSLLHRWQAVYSFTEGDNFRADQYIKKYAEELKERKYSESAVLTSLAYMYLDAGRLNEAREHFKKAFLLEPENPLRINNLAYFLINWKVEIDEGLKLVRKALELSPDNYYSLQITGLAYHKLGKENEAYEILQKSWSLRRKYSVYNHEAYLQMEEVRKSAGMQ